MAYAIKYQYSFNTLQGDECIVYLFFKDYSGPITYLNPTARPFVLREFNSDGDLFKPIRGFQAELQFLSNNVSLDEFVSGEDDGVQVQLFFSGRVVWVGWLMQDDFQEDWIDTTHVITLRATDGLGQISQDPRVIIDGLAPIDEYLGDAISTTPIPTIVGATFINNLFYNGMLDRVDGNYYPLNQVYIDGKTFEGDDNQRMVEKINTSWGQCLYQYEGKWWFTRQEEFFHNDNVKGVVKGLLSNTSVDKSFNVNVGVNEDIKPVTPLMLRTIRRPFKETKVTYKYEFPQEIICNQTFLRGSLIVPFTNRYTIDCWSLYKGLSGSSTAPTGSAYRTEELDADGNITDNYITIETPPITSGNEDHVLVSQPTYINVNDAIDFGFDVRYPGGGTGPKNVLALNVSVEAAGGIVYYLDSDGEWVTSTGFGGLRVYVNIPYSSNESLSDWKTVNIRSKAVPAAGTLRIWLFADSFIVTTYQDFRNIEFGIREAGKVPGVVADYDRYTIPDSVRNNYEEQSWLDDSNNRAHKGALFFDNELTGDNWYRMRYPSERLTFKRHNAISKMLLNRRYRNKLEVTMLGIKWVDASVEKPIWLMNRFVFVDDAPTKRFMIANLSEIDFMNAQWRATLIEVYDTALDSEDTEDYPPHDYGNIYSKDV